jgi:hypothetical protein
VPREPISRIKTAMPNGRNLTPLRLASRLRLPSLAEH